MLAPARVTALNLARRPLANRRPLRRVVTALWIAAAVVLLVDLVLVVRHLGSSSAGRDRLVQLESEIAQEVTTLEHLERTLRGYDLDRQNEHVVFLNEKIAQRTFPWSQLFEQLGDVLPMGVRLQSLRPTVREEDEPQRRRANGGAEAQPADARRWVELQISGEAETDDAILELVDALFGHPAFSQPKLRNESKVQSSSYRFDLTVRYLPDLEPFVAEAPPVVETAELADEAEASIAPGAAP